MLCGARWLGLPSHEQDGLGLPSHEQASLRYDPNSLLYISKVGSFFFGFPVQPSSSQQLTRQAMDLFDINDSVPGVSGPLFRIQAPSLVCRLFFLGGPLSSSPLLSLAEVKSLLSVLTPQVIGVQSDILFPVSQQRELAQSLRWLNPLPPNHRFFSIIPISPDLIFSSDTRAAGAPPVTYYELDSLFGHDTFLLDVLGVGGAVKGFLERTL